jgi:CHAT domain-containing protein
MSKAEALQEAQKALIDQNKKIHPAQWAPFILIGNWL